MFGGWAVYKNRVIFAIIVNGELYFKIEENNCAEFEKMEMPTANSTFAIGGEHKQ